MAYGTGTRSHLRSTEHRQMQRDRQEATREWESSQRVTVEVETLCTCLSFRYPHKRHGWEAMPDWRRRYS